MRVNVPIPEEPLPTQFIVIVDSRENRPYTFLDLTSDARDGRRPLLVRQVTRALPSGDYSILGLEDQVAVERKSLEDLYGTIGQGRERFHRELERLAKLAYAAVVVEAEWSEILAAPPTHSQLSPKTVFRSILAWSLRYPAVRWWMMPDRTFAEATTFRILERYWKENQT